MTTFNPPELWNAQKIADYLGRDRKTVLNMIAADRKFPRPLANKRRHRLWVAAEVVQHLLRRAA